HTRFSRDWSSDVCSSDLTKTRDFVIRRELAFGEGDPFNRSMVIRGRNAIQGLGFFSAVEVTTAPGSSADKVVLNVNVTETSTGEIGRASCRERVQSSVVR